jgi:hypothetical protein
MSWRLNLATLAMVATLGLDAGCGGSGAGRGTEPQAARSETEGSITGGPAPSNDRMTALADLGALDRSKVEAAFRAAMPEVDRCLAAGRKRVRYLDGDIELFMQVDGSGKAVLANLTRSTLGDYETEACILAAYKVRHWPRPIDGKVGEIHQRYQFGVASDADAAQPWSADALGAAMARDASPDAGTGVAASPYRELLGALGRCREEARAAVLEVTMYLDQDGFVQAVGLATDQASGRSAADCVATVVKTTSFPSPGSSPIKVTVSVK